MFPEVRMQNELVLPGCVLRVGMLYGFMAQVAARDKADDIESH